MRTLTVLLSTLLATVTLTQAAEAKSKPFKSCGNVNHKINGKNYKIAIKVKVKGLTCGQSKVLFVTVATGSGGMLQDKVLESLRYRCKDDKSQAAAKKKGRIAMTCTSANGKYSAKAWVLGG